MDPHVGEVILFAGTWTPAGWVVCDGAAYKVSDYPDAYKLLGNQFGGTPGSTFCVPDLRGRLPIGAGAGPGLTPRKVNDQGGAAAATLTADNLPPHGHAMRAASGPTVPGMVAVDTRFCATRVIISGKVQPTGQGEPFSIGPPTVGLSYLIALKGEPAPPPTAPAGPPPASKS